MKDKIYSFLIKIPDAILTVIQLLLVVRFIAKLFSVSDTIPFFQWLYAVTNILTFPVGTMLRTQFVESTLLYETLLAATGVIYVMLYLIIQYILAKLFNEEE